MFRPVGVLGPEAVGVGVVLVVSAGFFGFLALVYYLEWRKEMRLIEAGEYRQEAVGSWVLAAGLVALAVGLASVVNAVARGVVPDEGLVLAFLGVAGLVYYHLRRREARRADVTDGDGSD
jgi:hypothetical protein